MKWNPRKTLAYAFAASLALHFFVLPLLHTGSTDPGTPEKILTYTREHPIPTPKPTPHPTPSPTPKPHAATPPHAHTDHVRVKPPRMLDPAVGKKPGIIGANDRPDIGHLATGEPGPISSGPPATSAPAPTPTPTPETTKAPCANPNVAPGTIAVSAPETPALAQAQGITGEVSVVVSLDERSRLTAARIAKSPSALLNAAALRAARDTTYRTEVRDCKPIAADYLFVVEFMSE
jgi:TonB family protein